jgi:hypothetical protein
MVSSAGELGVSSLHVTFPTGEEWAALGSLGFQQRRGIQYHWENRGYNTFDDFLADLKQRKRKNIRQVRVLWRSQPQTYSHGDAFVSSGYTCLPHKRAWQLQALRENLCAADHSGSLVAPVCLLQERKAVSKQGLTIKRLVGSEISSGTWDKVSAWCCPVACVAWVCMCVDALQVSVQYLYQVAPCMLCYMCSYVRSATVHTPTSCSLYCL